MDADRAKTAEEARSFEMKADLQLGKRVRRNLVSEEGTPVVGS
jgi:hypothetical protein